MKTHSNAFKEEIKQLGKQHEVLIEFGNTTLTSEYINSATPSYEGSLLKSVMKQLELDSVIEIPVGTEINFKYGLLIDGDYEIYKVELHPSMENTILITLNPIKRFNNVEGNLTVSYNSDLGDLTGMGGKVASFEVSFNPTELIKKLNPYIREYIGASNNVHVAFIKVEYRDRFTDDRITAKPNISLNFINVGEINP